MYSYPLKPDSAEYRKSRKELIDYNKKIVRLSNIFQCLLFMPVPLCFIVAALLIEFHCDLIPIHTGVFGVLRSYDFLLISFVMICVAVGFYLYNRFELRPLRGRRYANFNAPLPARSYSVDLFPFVIKEFLPQGTEAAWYFVHHRQESDRKAHRVIALIMIVTITVYSCLFISDAFKVLSEPPEYTQMQTAEFRLTYDTEDRLYGISCYDTATSWHSYELSEKELEKYAAPLLPYLECDGQPVHTWPEAETVLKDGKEISLANRPGSDEITVFITAYEFPSSLCALEVGTQTS